MADFNLPGDDTTELFIFDKFGTLNTRANRPMIKDEEFSWIENFMPLGDGNLRTLPGEGATLYTTTGTIIFYCPYNIGSTSYVAVFLADGSAVQVKVSDGSTTTIGGASTFWTSGELPACAQWQSKYLLIVSALGYWIWDGTNLFTAGGVSPDVTVTRSGSGYTSAPTVTAYGGSGSGAAFTAVVANGAVTSVTVTNPGTGYLVGETVQLAFTGGGSDTSARAVAAIATTGGVASVNITAGGTGYTSSSVVTFSGGGGSGAQAVVTGAFNGVITQISVTNPGTGYTSNPTVAVSVGSGFTGTVDIRRGQVSGITVSAGGSGYTSDPQVVIGSPDSSSFPVVQATAVATISAGAVATIVVTNPGLGYIKIPTVTLVGGNNAAAATLTMMPFGVAGSSIETYQSQAWIANGTNVTATAPGSTSNFATSAGGVAFVAVDSFLRRKVVSLKQTNGFLYLFGDSSINVVSNVQVGATGTTTFNNANVDPQVGTAWRDTVVAFGRALVFANSTGVYALYGGAAEKVSEPLDGLFANATFNTGAMGGVTPVAAVTNIFGRLVYMLLFTTIDPFTNTQRTLLAMWDGAKWWMGSQVQALINLGTQEIDSTFVAYGTEGKKLFPLFTTANTTLKKVFQTKLRGEPAHIMVKQVNRVYVTAENQTGTASTMDITIDNERGQGTTKTVSVNGFLTFVGSGPISFVGTGPIVWLSAGLVLDSYNPNGVYGRFIGMTGQTTAPDLTLLQLSILFNEYSPGV